MNTCHRCLNRHRRVNQLSPPTLEFPVAQALPRRWRCPSFSSSVPTSQISHRCRSLSLPPCCCCCLSLTEELIFSAYPSTSSLVALALVSVSSLTSASYMRNRNRSTAVSSLTPRHIAGALVLASSTSVSIASSPPSSSTRCCLRIRGVVESTEDNRRRGCRTAARSASGSYLNLHSRQKWSEQHEWSANGRPKRTQGVHRCGHPQIRSSRGPRAHQRPCPPLH